MALLVSVTVASTLFSNVALAVTRQYEETVPEFETVIFENDGTNIDGLTGTFTQGKDDNGNLCLSLGKATFIKQLFKNFDTEKAQGIELINDDGQMMISFDFLARQQDCGFNMYIAEEGGMDYAVFLLTGGGMMYYNDATGTPGATYLPSHARAYEVDKWYNIKMVFYTNETYID